MSQPENIAQPRGKQRPALAQAQYTGLGSTPIIENGVKPSQKSSTIKKPHYRSTPNLNQIIKISPTTVQNKISLDESQSPTSEGNC